MLIKYNNDCDCGANLDIVLNKVKRDYGWKAYTKCVVCGMRSEALYDKDTVKIKMPKKIEDFIVNLYDYNF